MPEKVCGCFCGGLFFLSQRSLESTMEKVFTRVVTTLKKIHQDLKVPVGSCSVCQTWWHQQGRSGPHPLLLVPHLPRRSRDGKDLLPRLCHHGTAWVLLSFPSPWSVEFFTDWKKLIGHKVRGEECKAVIQKACVTDKSFYRRSAPEYRTSRIPFSF